MASVSSNLHASLHTIVYATNADGRPSKLVVFSSEEGCKLLQTISIRTRANPYLEAEPSEFGFVDEARVFGFYGDKLLIHDVTHQDKNKDVAGSGDYSRRNFLWYC